MQNHDVSDLRLGVDLGGTKIEVIVIGPKGEELFRHRLPTPQGDYEATIQTISALILKAESTLKLGPNKLPVGVGIPGTISPITNLVKNANSVCLIGKPLDKDLEKILSRPVRLANDANCFALSEAVDGSAQGAAVVFGAILGTGCGSGIVINGKALEGANRIAGEWGHNPLPWPKDEEERVGRPCFCGQSGCIETFVSGPGMSADHLLHTGKKALPHEIASQAEQGCIESEATLQRYEDRLARALAVILNILDPSVIVFGGGLSNIDRLYTNIPKLWKRYVFSDEVRTPIVKPKFGDSSGVRGAARLN